MKNSYSNIFPFTEKILNKTVKVLNKGVLVGMPTETVYGLAGNAYSKTVIAKIFKFCQPHVQLLQNQKCSYHGKR